MDTYNINDKDFITSDLYKNFIANNPGKGYLKIRAYSASEALPISNLKIIVSKKINSSNVIFYEGLTNNSGIIEKIILPTPSADLNAELPPPSTTYEIKAIYQNITNYYKVNMYDNIYVIQTINIVPDLKLLVGDN